MDPEPTPPKKSGVSCVVIGLCVAGGGVLLTAVLAALLLPAVTKSIARAQATSCANNLRQLWTLQSLYASQFGGPNKDMPSDAGVEFWLKLTKTQPPLIDPTELEVFLCPVKPVSAPGSCDYLGPSRPVGELKAADPVGADRPGNHPEYSGNVLFKDGRVMEYWTPEFGQYAGKLKP